MHSYRDLLGDNPRGKKYAQKLRKKSFSPSLFVLHLGLKGTFDNIEHHSILFGNRYKSLLDDIFEHGVINSDFSLYLHHPSATDPSVAPEGHSTLYALVPVPHLGKFPNDWSSLEQTMEDWILDKLEKLIPDIRERIVEKRHYTPDNFTHDLNAWLGSAFSLEPTLTQSAWFRTHNRDDEIPNMYFVGAGTHPGAGIPGVVGSAKATAGLILDELHQ